MEDIEKLSTILIQVSDDRINEERAKSIYIDLLVGLGEKIDNKMKLISKDLKADVYSTFGEAPNFKLIEVGKNNYSLSYISSQGHGSIEDYLVIFSMEKNKLKKIASINLDSSRDVGMVYHETKTKYTFVKSDKKFYDIKLDVTELEDSKVVKTYKEIYTYKNGKYSLNK